MRIRINVRRRCSVLAIILTLPRIPLRDYYLVFASFSRRSPFFCCQCTSLLGVRYELSRMYDHDNHKIRVRSRVKDRD